MSAVPEYSLSKRYDPSASVLALNEFQPWFGRARWSVRLAPASGPSGPLMTPVRIVAFASSMSCSTSVPWFSGICCHGLPSSRWTTYPGLSITI